MSARGDRQGKVQTVLGLVDPAELGPTLMHEHVFIDLTPPPLRLSPPPMQEEEITLCNCFGIAYGQKPFMRNYRLDETEVAIAELNEMKAAGGRALVDLTVGGLNPEPERLVEVAKATGAPLVDLHRTSVAAVQAMGPVASLELTPGPPSPELIAAARTGTTQPVPGAGLQTTPARPPAGPDDVGPAARPTNTFDYTHLGPNGAEVFAAQVAQGLAEAVPALRRQLAP